MFTLFKIQLEKALVDPGALHILLSLGTPHPNAAEGIQQIGVADDRYLVGAAKKL